MMLLNNEGILKAKIYRQGRENREEELMKSLALFAKVALGYEITYKKITSRDTLEESYEKFKAYNSET